MRYDSGNDTMAKPVDAAEMLSLLTDAEKAQYSGTGGGSGSGSAWLDRPRWTCECDTARTSPTSSPSITGGCPDMVGSYTCVGSRDGISLDGSLVRGWNDTNVT